MNTPSASKIIATLLMAFIVVKIQAQFISTNDVSIQTFTAIRKGKIVGWLKTMISQNGEEKSLTIDSKLTISIVISFEAKATTVNKFKGNTLIQAGVYRTLNGKEKLDNQIQLTDGRYRVNKGEAKQVVDKSIRHTVASIYFLEPVGVTEVFSEVYLQFMPLKYIGASVYVSELPDGGTMTYAYKLGKLTSITASTSYGTVLFQLNQ
ncbi:MAG: DUF6134 family protein [Bacteroidota bacterium]